MVSSVRERINVLLRTDSELDAFCLDEYPDIFQRFARGMERIEKVNLLLWVAGEVSVSAKLDAIARRKAPTQHNAAGDHSHAKPALASTFSGKLAATHQTADRTEELSFQRLRRACAQLLSGTPKGCTAYLVSNSHLVTSATLVRNHGIGGSVEVQFPDLTTPVLAHLRKFDDDDDWALLELAAPLLDRTPLPLQAPIVSEARWVALGFAGPADRRGLVLSGEVRCDGSLAQDDAQGLVLLLDEPLVDPAAGTQGALGSPVLSFGRVLGHLRSASPYQDQRSPLRPGTVYACPAHLYIGELSLTEGSGLLRAKTPVGEYDPLWYSARPELERKAINKLRAPGVPLTVQAPEGYGKRWFVEHVLARIQQQDLVLKRHTHIVRFNIRKNTDGLIVSLDALLSMLLRQLLLALKVDRVEQVLRRLSKSSGGAALRFREGLEDVVLPLIENSDQLLLLIEEGDFLHASPIETDFFALLRALAEERNSPYDRLRLVVTIATEAGLLESTNHSWFFGLSPPVVLDGFSPKQLQAQASLYGLQMHDPGLATLFGLTAGHPFLSRLAMYEAAASETTLAEALAKQGVQNGIFSASLRHLHMQLDKQGLMGDLCQVIKNPRHRIPFEQYIKLYRKGLIFESAPGEYSLRCSLFASYFTALCN